MLTLNKNAFVIVIVFLGITMLCCVAGIIGLAVQQTAIPDELKVTLASVVTGMIGMLSKTPEQPPPGN